MPVTWHKVLTKGEPHEIPEFWCEGCGKRASFGLNVAISKARSRDDPRLGQWWCGWRDGQPVCKEKVDE